MKQKAIQGFFTHFLCLLAFYSFAQPSYNKDSLISSKIADLTVFWKKYNDISNARPVYESYAIIPELYAIKVKDSVSVADYQKKVNDAKIALLKQDIGLQGTANYLENFSPGFNSDDDLAYNRRFQAGLDWNILSDGIITNRYKQKILKNENAIHSLKPKTKIAGDEYIAISHKIIYAFNIHKIKLLEKRQQIINDKITIAN